jgi:hypothetical protein
MPTTLAVLAMFLPGFIAMEVIYHLGPRNFRSNSESYKYVLAVLLGAIVFAVTTAFYGESFNASWDQLTDAKLLTNRRVLWTVLAAIVVGWAWHTFFTHVMPGFYRLSRAIKLQIFGTSRHFHGPIKVFDTAMDLMDDCMVMVFLKDGRVLKGGLVAYPDLDGDSGLVVRVIAYGHLPDPKKSWTPVFEADLPTTLESLIWIPGGQIEYVSAVKAVASR